jgi:hypothetical protein
LGSTGAITDCCSSSFPSIWCQNSSAAVLHRVLSGKEFLMLQMRVVHVYCFSYYLSVSLGTTKLHSSEINEMVKGLWVEFLFIASGEGI